MNEKMRALQDELNEKMLERRQLEIEINNLKTFNESNVYINDRETREIVNKLENLQITYN